jgi:hypothetical protein
LRAVIAYVASRLVSGAESSCIFDFSARGHRSMGGTVNESCINVYDFSENCQLAGHMSNGLFHLFHCGEQVHVSLEILGVSFRGRDHSNGLQFMGGVNGSRIWIKDHADLRRYSYWCEAPQFSRLPGQEPESVEGGEGSQAQQSGPRIQTVE